MFLAGTHAIYIIKLQLSVCTTNQKEKKQICSGGYVVQKHCATVLSLRVHCHIFVRTTYCNHIGKPL